MKSCQLRGNPLHWKGRSCYNFPCFPGGSALIWCIGQCGYVLELASGIGARSKSRKKRQTLLYDPQIEKLYAPASATSTAHTVCVMRRRTPDISSIKRAEKRRTVLKKSIAILMLTLCLALLCACGETAEPAPRRPRRMRGSVKRLQRSTRSRKRLQGTRKKQQSRPTMRLRREPGGARQRSRAHWKQHLRRCGGAAALVLAIGEPLETQYEAEFLYRTGL